MWSGLTSLFYSSGAPSLDDDVNHLNEALAAELTVLPAKDSGWVLVDRPNRSAATAIACPPLPSDSCPSEPSIIEHRPPPTPDTPSTPLHALSPQHRSVPHYARPCLNSLLGGPPQRMAPSGGHGGGGKISRNSVQNANRANEVRAACKRQRKYNYDIRNAPRQSATASGKRC